MIKHRKRGLPRIQLDENHLPYRWQENLIKNQEVGGVFLVFLSGKNKAEIQKKVKHLKQFVKTIKDFATVKPVGIKWEGNIGGDPNNPFPIKVKNKWDDPLISGYRCLHLWRGTPEKPGSCKLCGKKWGTK